MLRRLLRWVQVAPGQPRLAATEQVPWRRVLPMALIGVLVGLVMVGMRVGLPDEVDPIHPFAVGHQWGLHTELAERGAPIPDDLSRVGYDGQWFVGQAYDPLLLTDLATTFDAPRYRSIRVLLRWGGCWRPASRRPSRTRCC